MLLHLTSLLAQNCFLLPNFQKQLGEFPFSLHVLSQPVVLILQGGMIRLKDEVLGETMRGYIQHFILD